MALPSPIVHKQPLFAHITEHAQQLPMKQAPKLMILHTLTSICRLNIDNMNNMLSRLWLATLKCHLQAQKEAALVQEAALETAQAAVQQLRQQLSSSSSSGAALREAQAESESLREQLEDSARKYSTVKQARERAMTEVVGFKHGRAGA